MFCGWRLVESLNPSFNGIWSRTQDAEIVWHSAYLVLILLLMEYGLGLGHPI